MGWSCSAAASKTMQAIEAYSCVKGFDASNCVSARYFFECDKIEHEDGSITGEVMDIEDGRIIGKAKIDGNGVMNMPGLDVQDFKEWCSISSRWRAIGEITPSNERKAGVAA